MEAHFPRIERLPPYVFNIVNELKAQARARGEDIIDFGMGNPERPTPAHIVDKLVEVARRPDTHRYSASRGIPRLRRAICNWYAERYQVELDADSEAIVTIGSKEGLAHLALATVGQGVRQVVRHGGDTPEGGQSIHAEDEEVHGDVWAIEFDGAGVGWQN